MKLYKIAFQNVRKSMKDYMVYFFTLILGVAVFYVFDTLAKQTVMLPLLDSTKDLLHMFNGMLNALSIFVAVVLGCLILYANQFLMKRRKKEFGTYMVLGMGKGKISAILLYETAGIGMLSLIIGIAVGVIFSQLTSMLVANMFAADMSRFTFSVSGTAVLTTVLCFIVMYIPVILFNTCMIGRCRLIDLLQAGRKNEEIKLKNGVVCTVVFLLAAGLLGQAYWQVTRGAQTITEFADVLFVMVRGALGTLLLFWSLSGFLLRFAMAGKAFYFHNLHSFTLRQVHNKINTMVVSMTVICLMLFVTICVLSTGMYMNREATAELDKKVPADIQITKKQETKGDFEAVAGILTDMGISKEDFREARELSCYVAADMTLGETLGSTVQSAYQKEMPDFDFSAPTYFLKISDYNKYAKLTGQKMYTLKDNEYMILANYEFYANMRNAGLAQGSAITLLGERYVPKYKTCKDGYLWMSTSSINGGIFLVPDGAVKDLPVYESVFTANYEAASKKEKLAFEKELNDTLQTYSKRTGDVLHVTTRLSSSEASIGVAAMATFSALYIGIVFLITSAAILALKELSESADNRERYEVLRKLGAKEQMIRKSLFGQIGIFFALPLLVAILHSVFGIQVVKYMFDMGGRKWLVSSIVSAAGIIVLIYGGYFLITYFCSRNMIRETRGERIS